MLHPDLHVFRTTALVVSIMIAAFGTSACGGGGGQSQTAPIPPPAAPQQTTLTFNQPGPVALLVGDVLTNTASGQGSGAITYLSSNTAIATVTNDGVTTIVGAGTAIITANKAGDSQFLSSTVSYTINASLVPQTIAFATTGSVPLVVGATLTNIATGGAGTGAISYESSNTTVATVTSVGTVTAISTGLATITATKAADTRNAAAMAIYSVNVTLAPQTVIFERAGQVTVPLAGTLSNVASAQGTGMVTYQSSDTSVATVNTLGLASVVGIGSATVTASKAADSTYAAASATYRINSSVAMTAWIGANDTLLDFPASANGLELYRSRDENCDDTNYLACNRGQKSTLMGMTIVDTAATLTNIGYYTLKKNQQTVAKALSTPHFLPRTLQAVVTFKNKMWVIGGGSPSSDVWSSADGATWKLEIGVSAFDPRFRHQVVEFNNKLWLFGGTNGSQVFEDVWTSTDGLYWVKQPNDAAFANLNQHRVVVFDNQLWLIAAGAPNDTWSSVDGATWVHRSVGTSSQASQIPNIVVFKNELWSLGAAGEASSSADGVSWTQRALIGGFPQRNAEYIVHGGKLWIVGGYVSANNIYKNDVWSSTDGTSWTSVTNNASFTPRANHRVLSFNGQLWVIAGGDEVATYKDDVWSSGDGFEWRQRAGHQFNSIQYQQLTPFASKLWLTAGTAGSQFSNTVRSSSDGIAWSEDVHVAPFPQRSGHRTLNYTGRLWIIGGGSLGQKDVWSSLNGAVWTQQTSNTPFSARAHHAAAVFNGKMWVIGGLESGFPTSGPRLNDVWSSIDGINWTQDIANAAFSARFGHEVVVYNGKMWLIGGNDGVARSDVWSTSDGITWNLETGAAVFPARYLHQALVFNNALLVVGGGSSIGGYNDVWSSTDGVLWTRLVANADFPAASGHSVTAFNSKLWLIGGRASSTTFNDNIWSSDDGIVWRRAIRTTIE